jgi:DNA-cytosine methyltransferase
MGTDLMAVRALLPRVDVQHKFACDSRPESRVWIKANFPEVEAFYDDVTSPEFSTNAKYVDLFFAGFPCQPFSSEGKGQGFEDELGRGNIITHIVSYLRRRMPKLFLLENVKGLLDRHPESFLAILTCLSNIKCKAGAKAYKIHWKLLDSGEYGAVPQHRPRLYICGILASSRVQPFKFPHAVPAPSLRSLLDKRNDNFKRVAFPTSPVAAKKVKVAVAQLRGMGINPLKVPVAINCDAIRSRWFVDKVPCLTAARASNGGFWVTCKNSRMSVAEMMRCQGMNPETLVFPKELSKRAVGHMIGNAFTQTVIERIVLQMFAATRMISKCSQELNSGRWPWPESESERACTMRAVRRPSRV